jgi:hypothetical protein
MVNKRRKKGGVRHVGACGEHHKGTPAGHTYCQKTQGYGPGFRCVAVPGASKGDCVDNAELEFYANNQNHNSNKNNNNGNNNHNHLNSHNNNNMPNPHNNIAAKLNLAGIHPGGESKGERKTHKRTPSSGGRRRKKRRKTRRRKTRRRKTRRRKTRRKSRRRRKR